MNKLKLPKRKNNLTTWTKLVNIIKNPKNFVTIAVVGKYIELQDSYKSIYEALSHGAIENHAKINILKINSENLTKKNIKELLGHANGILIPGGFGDRGIDGKILAAQFARENKISYLGICLGMQIMVIEFAKNVLEWKEENSTEFESK